MDQLKAMESFACVAQAKSFSSAARELGVSRALVTSRVQGLERHIGAKLLHRTTRSLSLTEIGATYYEFCHRILNEIEGEERFLRDLQQQLRGNLRVVVPKSFGPLHMSAACTAFAGKYPELALTLVVEDTLLQTSSALAEEYDVAVRLAHIADSSLMVRKLADLKWVVCASPGYLDRHGRPATPDALDAHNCLIHLTLGHGRMWRFMGKREPLAIKVRGSYSANSVNLLRDAAITGLGIAMLPTYCVASDLQSGRLVALLTGWPIADQPLYAVHPFGTNAPQKVRAFVEFLAGWFREPPWDTPARVS
jgi:DNA-binding transcriptional LysR family regulator